MLSYRRLTTDAAMLSGSILQTAEYELYVWRMVMRDMMELSANVYCPVPKSRGLSRYQQQG